MAKNILVVHDVSEVRQLVGGALKDVGYDVVEAIDAGDALIKLTEKQIHLIVSRFNMSEMNGIDFTRAAKQIPACKYVPVIMLSSEDEKSAHASHAVGVATWITKPLQPQKIVVTVSSFITP